jgi:hypothetical protein
MSSALADAYARALAKVGAGNPAPSPDMSASYAALAEIERRKEARKDKGLDQICNQAIPTGFYSGRAAGATTKRFLTTKLDPRHQGLMKRLCETAPAAWCVRERARRAFTLHLTRLKRGIPA